MQEIFEKALAASGSRYLEYERQILDGQEPETSQMLSANLNRPDPIARLMAQALLDGKKRWRAEYKGASDYLLGRIVYAKRGPRALPYPYRIAETLSSEYHDHIANYIALHVLKDDLNEVPGWLTMGEMLYLQKQKLPSTTSALLRFVVNTDVPNLREHAIDSVKAISDPDLHSKIEAERQRAREQGRAWPSSLETLEQANR